MKAISVRAPWWFAILEWGKRVENRFWRAPIAYRGPVLIHASAWWDLGKVLQDFYQCDVARNRTRRVDLSITIEKDQIFGYMKACRGGIVGIAQLTDCRWNRRSGDPWAIDQQPALDPRYRSTGALGLVLADPRPLPFVPLKGALGLFDITPESIMADPRRAKDGPEHSVAVSSLIKLLKEQESTGYSDERTVQR